MAEGKKQIKKHKGQYILIGIMSLVGFMGGILMTEYAIHMKKQGMITDHGHIFFMVILLVEIYFACFVQIIIHEAGHLIFGRLTGYQFSSFRIGTFMWIKKDGKLKLKKLSLAGTGGQCLMSPPDMVGGKMPYVLYNLGGILTNGIVGLICLGVGFLFKQHYYLSTFLIVMGVIGLLFALTNGIPMPGLVNNDGHNAWSLGKSTSALRSFWLQMKIAEQIAKGIRLKDMPEEWFSLPTPEEMKNSMNATIGVFRCNRLIDAKAFDEANQLMEKLLKMDTGIVDIHRKLLICDRIYCDLIRGNRQDYIDEMLDKKQKEFMKAMKKFPSVLRTQYAYALLAQQNQEEAYKIKKQFEKCSHTYPYPSDIESEQELIDIVDALINVKEEEIKFT